MKKSILILSMFFFALQLSAQEPQIKFYMKNGAFKTYKLSDIDSIGVIDKKNNYVMEIHYQGSLTAYYPTEIIGSLKLEKDSSNQSVLNVYIFSFPKPYLLSLIDSIIFYQDIYQPLTIGSQVWMLKNLNVDHYRNGNLIPLVTDTNQWKNLTTGAWCYYDNDANNGTTYGKLYNWYAVDDSCGFAPSGWHVPSDAEWTILSIYLGGESGAGGKLKEAGTSHWLSSDTGTTNESGFSAIPGGLHDFNGSFLAIGINGNWWSSTEHNFAVAWSRGLRYLSPSIRRSNISRKVNGFSVRCVRDN